MTEFKNTDKQREIMKRILDAADAGAFITLAELHAQLSYGASASKQAILCSLEVLEKHKFIEKDYRHKKSMVLKPTPAAYHLFRPRVT